MVRIVEELPAVLLGVPVPAHPEAGEDPADDVRAMRGLGPADLIRVRRVVAERRSPAGIAGRADHRVAERLRDLDLELAVRRETAGDRVVHDPKAARVRARRSEPGGVQVGADLGVRRLTAELVHVLGELEELEAPEAEVRQELEHLLEPARAAAPAGRGRSGPPGSSARPDSPSSASARWRGCSRCCGA